jgi:hypothetical protein
VSVRVDIAGGARVALIVHRDAPGTFEARLGRILDFFGVPVVAKRAREIGDSSIGESDPPFAVFGAADTLAKVLADARSASVLRNATAMFAYVTEDSRESSRELLPNGGIWGRVSKGQTTAAISGAYPDFTGPMSGVECRVPLAPEQVLLATTDTAATAILSADGASTFVRSEVAGVPVYVSGSNALPDIDSPVHRNFYDVKAHFYSAVPVVMFIAATFRNIMWRSAELGACLIIDDPLLKSRYGFCDFRWLQDEMRSREFTTSVAFIPWNWRRTSQRASEFFRSDQRFSVSIHGCDHVAAEFGTDSVDLLKRRARLAQDRMRRHLARTRIDHDPIMVFPQGVFSAASPAVLKSHDFVAAVNTEINPSDAVGQTLIRDVWDTAIVRYGSFAIYTRRYEHHGLENFAFDLLLGKPCFIVAHHGEFRNGAKALLALIDRLHALNCRLQWRSPREVVRRAYRTRRLSHQQVQMYGTEALIANTGDDASMVEIEKQETDPSCVTSVVAAGAELQRTRSGDGLRFTCELASHSESLVTIRYARDPMPQTTRRSAKYDVSVATRRLLCEFRDEFVQKWYPRRPVTQPPSLH